MGEKGKKISLIKVEKKINLSSQNENLNQSSVNSLLCSSSSSSSSLSNYSIPSLLRQIQNACPGKLLRKTFPPTLLNQVINRFFILLTPIFFFF
jgi:hypothetical protein